MSAFRLSIAPGALLLALLLPLGCSDQEQSSKLLSNKDAEQKVGVIVFVHGFTGHYERTWGQFPKLLLEDNELKFVEDGKTKGLDVFLWGYPSGVAKNPNLNLLGEQLWTEITVQLKQYPRIYLVAHSLGGLVTQTMIVDQLVKNHADSFSQIRHIFMFGTPSQGLELPGILAGIDRKLGYDIDVSSDTVDKIRTEWINRVYAPTIRHGEESSKRRMPVTVVSGLQDKLVNRKSSESFFRDPPPKVVQGDHTSMKEPHDRTHTGYLIVRDQIKADIGATSPKLADFKELTQQLGSALLNAQKVRPFGGFMLDIGKPDSDLQVWSTAQALTGLLANAGSVVLDPELARRLKPAFSYIMHNREPYGGWARYKGQVNSVVEVTSWVGFAYLQSLKAKGFWDPIETAKAKEVVKSIYDFLLGLQSKQGGWSHLHVRNPGPDTVTPYSTWAATEFLLQLKMSGALSSAATEKLDGAISRAIQYTLDRYKNSTSPVERGWEGVQGEGSTCSLSIVNLLLLEEARSAGFAFVATHPSYGTALNDWLQGNSKCGTPSPRETEDWLKQPAKVARPGRPPEYVQSGASIMRLPWGLILVDHLLQSPTLRGPENRAAYDGAVSYWNQLVDMAQMQVVLNSSGATFRAAEWLYALNRVSRRGEPALAGQ